MSHVTYLSNNKTACERPDMLGLDAIVVTYPSEKICRACTTLLSNYNEKMLLDDLVGVIPSRMLRYDDCPLSAFQGLALGVAAGSLFWCFVLVLVLILTGA